VRGLVWLGQKEKRQELVLEWALEQGLMEQKVMPRVRVQLLVV
jgi:hypothetical protein